MTNIIPRSLRPTRRMEETRRMHLPAFGRATRTPLDRAGGHNKQIARAPHGVKATRDTNDTSERPAYMPRIVGNRLVTPAELQRLHEQLLKNDVIEVIPDDMRAVVESEWPELTDKLPAKQALGTVKKPSKKHSFGWWARSLLSVMAQIAVVAWGVIVAVAVLWALFEEPD